VKTLVRFLIGFGVAALVAWGTVNIFGVPLKTTDYWNVHGVWLLIFLAFFPRLALLFSSIPFGGLFWWLGWIFAPRFLVAFLATFNYWEANPFLVTAAWLIAIGGESCEKTVIRRQYSSVRYRR
jgi:hypothetical protein